MRKNELIIDTTIVLDKPIETVTVEITKDMFPQMTDEQFNEFSNKLKKYIDEEYLNDDHVGN